MPIILLLGKKDHGSSHPHLEKYLKMTKDNAKEEIEALLVQNKH